MLDRMLNSYSSKKENWVTYWQSVIITYVITTALVVAYCVLQFNFSADEDILKPIFFCRVEVDNWLLFCLAKSLEALVPTTITFAILLLLTNEDRGRTIKTKIVLCVVFLGILGMLQPTMKSKAGFWIVLVLISVMIFGTLLEVEKLIVDNSSITITKHKNEKSDGCFSR